MVRNFQETFFALSSEKIFAFFTVEFLPVIVPLWLIDTERSKSSVALMLSVASLGFKKLCSYIIFIRDRLCL